MKNQSDQYSIIFNDNYDTIPTDIKSGKIICEIYSAQTVTL